MPQASETQNRSGIQPIKPSIGFVTGLPEGFNGSAIVRDPKFGRAPGVYPVHVVGTFVNDPANPVTAGGNINLCYIPSNVMLSKFHIVTGGVTGTLQDTLPTPTVYCSTLVAPVTTEANMSATDAQNWGTMYAHTPRAIGPQGAAVVQWYQRTLLQIAGASGPPATPLIYMIQWSPVYDSGT